MTNYEQPTKRQAIFDALPATRAQIHQATGVSLASVKKWIRLMHDAREVHVGEWGDGGRCTRPVEIFYPGPGEDAAYPVSAYSRASRDRADRLARGEPKRPRGRPPARRALINTPPPMSLYPKPKRDPLTAAFFGPA